VLLSVLPHPHSSACRGLALSQAASQAASLGVAASASSTPTSRSFSRISLAPAPAVSAVNSAARQSSSKGPGSPDGGEAGGEGNGHLRASVETNTMLKASLQNVSISVATPSGVTVAHDSVTPSGTWDAAAKRLQWRVSSELTRDRPVVCEAFVRLPAGDSEVAGGGLRTALASAPMAVQFSCEGVTISGIELEVQAAAVGSGSGSSSPTQPIAKLMRRFSAGDYQVVSTVASSDDSASAVASPPSTAPPGEPLPADSDSMPPSALASSAAPPPTDPLSPEEHDATMASAK